MTCFSSFILRSRLSLRTLLYHQTLPDSSMHGKWISFFVVCILSFLLDLLSHTSSYGTRMERRQPAIRRSDVSLRTMSFLCLLIGWVSFDALVQRFEPPEGRHRWDAPLFELTPTDDLPLEQIADHLANKRAPPPNKSTVNVSDLRSISFSKW